MHKHLQAIKGLMLVYFKIFLLEERQWNAMPLQQAVFCLFFYHAEGPYSGEPRKLDMALKMKDFSKTTFSPLQKKQKKTDVNGFGNYDPYHTRAQQIED